MKYRHEIQNYNRILFYRQRGEHTQYTYIRAHTPHITCTQNIHKKKATNLHTQKES